MGNEDAEPVRSGFYWVVPFILPPAREFNLANMKGEEWVVCGAARRQRMSIMIEYQIFER